MRGLAPSSAPLRPPGPSRMGEASAGRGCCWRRSWMGAGSPAAAAAAVGAGDGRSGLVGPSEGGHQGRPSTTEQACGAASGTSSWSPWRCARYRWPSVSAWRRTSSASASGAGCRTTREPRSSSGLASRRWRRSSPRTGEAAPRSRPPATASRGLRSTSVYASNENRETRN